MFDYLDKSNLWKQILSWLKQWKDNLLEIPEIDFDKTSKESFEEIKELFIRHWRKLLENEKLWSEGIIKAIFRKGEMLKMILEYFENQHANPYQELAELLKDLTKKYYKK